MPPTTATDLPRSRAIETTADRLTTQGILDDDHVLFAELLFHSRRERFLRFESRHVRLAGEDEEVFG